MAQEHTRFVKIGIQSQSKKLGTNFIATFPMQCLVNFETISSVSITAGKYVEIEPGDKIIIMIDDAPQSEKCPCCGK